MQPVADVLWVVFILMLLFWALRSARERRLAAAAASIPKLICKNCGTAGDAASSLGMGTLIFVLVGWIPTLLFGGWSSGAAKKCPACKQRTMIPTDTPAGRKLLNEHRG